MARRRLEPAETVADSYGVALDDRFVAGHVAGPLDRSAVSVNNRAARRCERSHSRVKLVIRRSVVPQPETSPAAYDALWAEYRTLHDWFGRGGNDMMMRLSTIRREASAR
jgi:hypothetical protein